jgi:hypothetical protein
VLDEFSWAVGLFEGEGTICITQTGYPKARIGIGMSDQDMAEKWAGIFPGGGKIMVMRASYENSKLLYWYEINRRDVAEEFLYAIRPYLSIKKKADCDRALEVIAAGRLRPKRLPTRRRPRNSATVEEIAAMRRDRAAGMSNHDVAEKYRISVARASRLTKDYA